MSFYLGSMKNLNAVISYADRIYYEMNGTLEDARQACRAEDVEFVPIAPRFSPAGVRSEDRMMINTPGQCDAEVLYGSYHMNMFNSRFDYPMHQVTLSVELSKHEIADIASSYPGRIEVMGFGRTELMCTRDPSLGNGMIEDEKGYRFPTYRDAGGTARILNSADLFLLPYLQQMGKMGVDSVGIDLRKRPEALAKIVAKAYSSNDVSQKERI